jgi:hypothetical protein
MEGAVAGCGWAVGKAVEQGRNQLFGKTVGRWVGLGGVAIAVSWLGLSSIAQAQMSEVPSPNGNGDFTTALVLGNRGYYTNNVWLVVKPANSKKPSEYGITCHDAPDGAVRSLIVPGAMVTAMFRGPANLPGFKGPNLAGDAIVAESGRYWLRVRGTQDELAYPAPNRRWDELGECYVRANVQMIAPVTSDAVEWRTKP